MWDEDATYDMIYREILGQDEADTLRDVGINQFAEQKSLLFFKQVE